MLLWVAVISGLVLSMLDQTIVGTALPAIVADVGQPSMYVWAVTAYLVPATVLLPVFTRLSDRYGRRQMLIVGLSIFVIGSTGCFAAPSMLSFVGARGVSGVGAAGLEALTFILIAELAGPTRRAAAQGLLAAAMGLSFVAGPLLGGIISDGAGWRWIFSFNIPLGLFAIVVIARVLPATVGVSESRRTPIDFAGIATLTASVAMVLIGLNQYLVVESWVEPRTGGLIALGALGLPLLIAVERRAVAPIIPPRLFANRSSRAALLAAAPGSFGLYACVVLMPRYFQEAHGLSAAGSGIRIYPFLLALLVSANLGATVIVRHNKAFTTLLAANTVALISGIGFAVSNPSSSMSFLSGLLLVLGLGLGPNLSGLQIQLQQAVAPSDLGAAMGALLLVRQVGGAVAIAAAATLYDVHLRGGGAQDSALSLSMATVVLVGAVLAIVAVAAHGRRGLADVSERSPEGRQTVLVGAPS